VWFGVVESACAGCSVLDGRRLREEEARGFRSWALGDVEAFDEADFGLDRGAKVPDISWDATDSVLTLLNASNDRTRAYHVSLRTRASVGSRTLPSKDGVTTFVVALAPRTCLDLCECDLAQRDELTKEDVVKSDVVDVVPPLTPPPLLEGESRITPDLSFPLRGSRFLCTQSANGGLSHFAHASTYYAVDFRCDKGTPVLAVADARVRDVHLSAGGISGVHCDALFRWNSVTLETDDGDFFEYVHVDALHVQQGDRVSRGQHIASSGDAGFCPEPHLHIERHRDPAPDAPSLPIAFRRVVCPPGSSSSDERAAAKVVQRQVPVAGEWWYQYQFNHHLPAAS